MPIQIIIDRKLPSVNHLYGFRGYRKFLKKEAVELRSYIDLIIKKDISEGKINIEEFKGERLSIVIEIYEQWLTKKGEIKRADISNKEKFCVDSVFLSLGLDDKQIFNHTMIKKHSLTEDKVAITIEHINN
jgi:Holliday junction resolvase RusA-like endonuclease